MASKTIKSPRWSETDARVFAGIDEAGLGPLLGPLSIGFSAFRSPRVPEPLRQLASCVSADPKLDATHIVVADSKRVFSRNPRGAARLEATVLAFDELCANAGKSSRGPKRGGPNWLQRSAAINGTKIRSERHPWFARFPARLVQGDDPRAQPGPPVSKLRRAMQRAKLEVIDLGFVLHPCGTLNDSFERTGSKNLTLWEASADVLKRLFKAYGTEGLDVWMDRHGGRTHYAAQLEDTFPDAKLRVLREDGSRGSEYRIEQGPRRLALHVCQKAEGRSFPVALGSCFAKYGRELAMASFNDFFRAHDPDLRPTAGYYTDGMRWLEEAGHALTGAGLTRSDVVRQR